MPDFPELPPIADAPLSVVLLTLRGASAHEQVLLRWLTYLQGRRSEISAGEQAEQLLVVEDGSFPDLIPLLERLASQYPSVALERMVAPGRVGEALRLGLAAATRPLVACAPCSPHYLPEFLKEMLAAIDRVHLVSGYRAGQPMPTLLRLLGQIYRLFLTVVLGLRLPPLPGWLGWRGHLAHLAARVFFGVRYQDVGCPLRLLRREILACIPIQSSGSLALIELLAKANFTTCMMGEEVPLPVTPVQDSLPTTPWWDSLREGYRLFSHPTFTRPPAPSEPIPSQKNQESVPSPEG